MAIDKGIGAQAGRSGASPGSAGGGTPGGPRGPGSPIEFRLDPASGVPTYLQLVHQVEHALRLGYLKPGDQLHKSLLGWLSAADAAGLDQDGIVALFTSALRDFHERRRGTGDRRGAASAE